MPPVLRHWPDQSGYFDSSKAWASTEAVNSKAASAIEPIKLR
jgi:hypothetical protein